MSGPWNAFLTVSLASARKAWSSVAYGPECRPARRMLAIFWLVVRPGTIPWVNRLDSVPTQKTSWPGNCSCSGSAAAAAWAR